MGRPLTTTDGSLTANPSLSYVICWKPRRGIAALQSGHASLIIDSQEFLQSMMGNIRSKDWYASWLNNGGGTIFQMRSASNSYAEDMAQWGGVQAVANSPLRQPTKWVALRGLDRAAMKAEWDLIAGKQGSHWKILDKNCASVVARILKAGGGDQHAASHKRQLVWWPSDVIRYARSMGNSVYMSSGDNAQVDMD